jgi:hypothetical protein
LKTGVVIPTDRIYLEEYYEPDGAENPLYYCMGLMMDLVSPAMALLINMIWKPEYEALSVSKVHHRPNFLS